MVNTADPALAQTQRPPLCQDGHVLVVTIGYPPNPSGTAVLIHNLLSWFDPASYTIVTGRSSGNTASVVEHPEATVVRTFFSVRRPHRLDGPCRDLQLPWVTARLTRLARKLRPRVIVGVYPDFHLMAATQKAARATRTPWVAYLHDTIAEGLSGTRLESRAIGLHERVLGEASSFLVMSRGMEDLYQRKYQLATRPIVHPYAEPVPTELPERPATRRAFWGGEVYQINTQSLGRVCRALEQVDCPIMVTGVNTARTLVQLGTNARNITREFFPLRADYLAALSQQALMVLALDWPDESPVHEDELATIFPTKTPEYLASGRPVLLHCPDHYFLNRYFREKGCGLVVSERSEDALRAACRELLEGTSERVTAMRRAALAAARDFDAARVADDFKAEIEKVARVKWGERVD